MPSGVYERKRTAETIRDILADYESMTVAQLRPILNREIARSATVKKPRKIHYKSLKAMMNDLKIIGLVRVEREESIEVQESYGGTPKRIYYAVVPSRMDDPAWKNPQQARKDMQK